MQANITADLVKKLKAKDKAFEIWDTSLRGYVIRIQPSGVKTYIVEYARHKRISIGQATPQFSAANARIEAGKIIADYVKGTDPLEAKRKAQSGSFRDFIENVYQPYISSPDFRESHTKEALRRLRKLYPLIGEKKLVDIDPFTFEKYRSARLKSGITVSTVNRELDMLKAALAVAVEKNLLKSNPVKKVKRYTQEDDERVRYLSPEEDKSLREALDAREAKHRQERENSNEWRRERGYRELPGYMAFTDHIKPMTLVALNTGMRRGELFSFDWKDIDWITRVITIPATRAKSRKTRRVPMNDETYAILDALKKHVSSEGLVFPNQNGRRLGSIKTAWARLLKDAKITDFHFHDCRHDFASKLVMSGVDLYTVCKLLGHSSIKVTEKYAHLTPDKLAAAVARLGAK
jgi:integrase